MAWDVVSMGDNEILPAVDIRQLQLNFDAIANQLSGSPVITFPNSDLVANAGMRTSGVGSLDTLVAGNIRSVGVGSLAMFHVTSGMTLPNTAFPQFLAHLSGNQTVGTALEPLELDDVSQDNGAGFDTTSFGWMCTNCFMEGIYSFVLQVEVQAGGAQESISIQIRKNDVTIAQNRVRSENATTHGIGVATGPYSVTSGDFFHAEAANQTTGNTVVDNNATMFFAGGRVR